MKFAWIFALFLIAAPISSPDNLIVKHKEETIATVNRIEYSIPLPDIYMVDQRKLYKLLNELEEKVNVPAKNATLDKHGNIVEEELGQKLHRKAFEELFYSYFFNQGPAKAQLPTLTVYPRVDSDLLTYINVKQIGYYVTYFNSRNQTRSHNINLSVNAINNHVVFPGETFSFNKVVGKRTIEKGYLRAPVIVKGELSEDIGGGICQVSSTLFNAVDRAGMEIKQRYSHSKRVPYVPPGRDATVSWYGPDFLFKNNYEHPILIKAKIYGGSVIISIFSTDEIEIEPRKVPSASEQLPEEIPIDGLDIEETGS